MEAIQQQSFPITEARVISAAAPPQHKSGPLTFVVLGIAGAIGLVLSFGAALCARPLTGYSGRRARSKPISTSVVLPCCRCSLRRNRRRAKRSMRIARRRPQSACRRDGVDQPLGSDRCRDRPESQIRDVNLAKVSLLTQSDLSRNSSKKAGIYPCRQGRDETTDCSEPAVYAAGHRRTAFRVCGGLSVDQGRRRYQRIPGDRNNVHRPRGRQVDGFVKSGRVDRACRKAGHRAGRRSEKSVPHAGIGATIQRPVLLEVLNGQVRWMTRSISMRRPACAFFRR